MPSTQQKQEVCIIGAGPAGMAAGIKLAQLGIPFVIIEKDLFPRHKICGDGLSGKSLLMLKKLDERLLTSLAQSDKANPSWGVRFTAPNLKSAHISFREESTGVPSGYVMPRRDFDQLLFSRLKRSNLATIIEGTTINSIEKTTGGYLVSSPEKDLVIKSKVILASTGFHPTLLKSLSPSNSLSENEALGIRAYFENISGFDKDNAIEIHFLKELLPCYLWIFPLGHGKANVGLALPAQTARSKKISLQKLLLELIDKYPYLKKRFMQASITGKPGAQRLPFFQGKAPVSGDHYMLLGDAARLVDPFTGEGISNAMLSGILAAETVAEACNLKNFSGKRLKAYDEKLYGELEKELTLGLKLQDLGKNAMLINLLIGRASRSKKIRDLLKDILFGMNSMKELGKPVFYFKLMLGID